MVKKVSADKSRRNGGRVRFGLLHESSKLATLHPNVFVFLAQYIALEVALRQIWKVQGKRESDFRISVSSVEVSLRKYGIQCEYALITRVFGSEERRNQKSAKKLRDELVHSLSKKGIQEIENRYQDLITDLEGVKSAFLSVA